MSEQLTPNLEEQLPAHQVHLTEYQAALDLMVKDIDTYAGTNNMPDWYREGLAHKFAAQKELSQNDQASSDDLLRLYTLSTQGARLSDSMYPKNYPSGSVLMSLENDFAPIGAVRLGAAMRNQGESSETLKEDILKTLARTDTTLHAEINALIGYYGAIKGTDLLAVNGDGFDGKVQQALLSNPKVVATIRALDMPKPKEDFSDYSECYNAWALEAITTATKGAMPTEWIEQAVLGIAKRDAAGGDAAINSMLERLQQFAPADLMLLASKTGIHAIDSYSASQIQRMIDFAKGAEQDPNKDYTAVMINRVGDHNGVLKSAADTFEDDSENSDTLFFEINSMLDIYRYTATLKRQGVKPSTMVLAAHSSKGMFIVGDERKPELKKFDVAKVSARLLVQKFNETGEDGPNVTGYAIEEASSLSKIVEDYMKPDSRDGKRKIFFNACYAGSGIDYRELDEQGEPQFAGKASVISKLAETLQNHGTTAALELYGADGAIQVKRTTHGVSFTNKPLKMGDERPDLAARRVTLKNGVVSTDEVSEIVLR